MGAVSNSKVKRWMAVGNFPLRRVISPAERKVCTPAYVAEIYTVGRPQKRKYTPPHVDCIIIPASSTTTHTSPVSSIYCSMLQHPPEMDEPSVRTHKRREISLAYLQASLAHWQRVRKREGKGREWEKDESE